MDVHQMQPTMLYGKKLLEKILTLPGTSFCGFIYFSSSFFFLLLYQPRPCHRHRIRRSPRTCQRSKHSILFPSSKTHRPLKPTKITPHRTLHLQRIQTSTRPQCSNPASPTADAVGTAFAFIDSGSTE